MKVTRSLDNLWRASIASTPVTRYHLALRSLPFNRLFFYLTLEAQWENTKEEQKTQRERYLWFCVVIDRFKRVKGKTARGLIYLPFLHEFHFRSLRRKVKKSSRFVFFYFFVDCDGLFLFVSICGLYVAYRSTLSLWTDNQAIDFFLNNLHWMEYEI